MAKMRDAAGIDALFNQLRQRVPQLVDLFQHRGAVKRGNGGGVVVPGKPRVQPIDKRIELFDQRIHAAVEASRKGFDASDQLRDNQQEQSRDQRDDNCVGQKQGKRAPQGCRADAIKGSPLKDAEKRIDEVSDAKTEQNRREDVQHPCKKTVDGA